MQVQSLGWEDPLEKIPMENPMDREAWQAIVFRIAKTQA